MEKYISKLPQPPPEEGAEEGAASYDDGAGLFMGASVAKAVKKLEAS